MRKRNCSSISLSLCVWMLSVHCAPRYGMGSCRGTHTHTKCVQFKFGRSACDRDARRYTVAARWRSIHKICISIGERWTGAVGAAVVKLPNRSVSVEFGYLFRWFRCCHCSQISNYVYSNGIRDIILVPFLRSGPHADRWNNLCQTKRYFLWTRVFGMFPLLLLR